VGAGVRAGSIGAGPVGRGIVERYSETKGIRMSRVGRIVGVGRGPRLASWAAAGACVVGVGALSMAAVASPRADDGNPLTSTPSEESALPPEGGWWWRSATEELLPVELLDERTMDVTLADVDDDGDLDVFVAREFATNVLLLNQGFGEMIGLASVFSAEKTDTEAVAVAELNGDGALDVVFVNEDTLTNELYLGSPGGLAFTEASDRLPTAGKSNAVAAFDADGDGDVDLFIGNDGQNHLLLNDGAANFMDATAANLPAAAEVTQDVQVGDIDGDGDLDVVVANEGRNRVLVNDGSGTFADETARRLPLRATAEVTRQAALGDADGDGDLDVYFANTSWAADADPRDRLLINDGNGNFTDESELRIPAVSGPTLDATFVDLDDDGDLDLLAASFFPGGVVVLVNRGGGRFVDETALWVPSGQPGQATDVEAADFDRDGTLDVYVAHWQSGPDQLLIGGG